MRLVGPNPVNASTRFSYDLPSRGRVRLDLCSMSGRLVHTLVDRVEEAGRHDRGWSANGLARGVYLARLSFEGRAAGSSRVVFLR